MNTEPKCNAVKRPARADGQSWVSWFFSGELCGAPATYETLTGLRCDGCIESFREAARAPNSVMNVIAGRARTEEEIAAMIRPIKEGN